MRRKSFRFSLLASVMLAAMTLTGCSSNDDNPVNNPTTTEGEDRDVDSFVADAAGPNSLDLFRANFIITGEDGKQQLSGIGTALDEADPTVLSIPVESLEQADRAFRDLVVNESQMTSTGTGNIVFTPTDAQGNKLGEIRLTPADDCIAHITWSEGLLPDDLISEVRFVDRKLWPNNEDGYGEATVKAGHYYEFVESGDDRPNYLIESSDSYSNFLCVYVDAFTAYFFQAHYSVPYSYDTDKKDEWGTYGVWYTDVKGKGKAKWYCRNSKAGMTNLYVYNKDSSNQDEAIHCLPGPDDLWKVYLGVQKYKDSEKAIRDYFWKDRIKDRMFWTGWHTEVSRHFHFTGYVLTKEGEDYDASYRAYTNLGMFSSVYKTHKDITVKDKKDYGKSIYPHNYKEFRDYNFFFTEKTHYKTPLYSVAKPF